MTRRFSINSRNRKAGFSMKLEGKVAIVTGAARGLGRAYALRLATLGADVAVLDLNLQGAADFGETLTVESVPAEIRSLGRRSIGLQSDLGQRSLVDDVVRQVKQELGRIDILVNNAGGAITPVERSFASTAPDEDLDLISAANLLSTIYCCQAVVPVMRDRVLLRDPARKSRFRTSADLRC